MIKKYIYSLKIINIIHMGGVSWSVHKQLQDKSQQQKNQIEDLERQNEELKKRYEERQKEIKFQQDLKDKEEREFQNKKLSALEDMTNSLQKKQDEEISSIKAELEKLNYIWCLEEIKEIDFEKILNECFTQLFKSENLEINIKENVRQLIKDLIKENEVKYLNLQIIGKTGVGKSTLVNAILGENVAEEKKGQPCTMETKCYESKKYDFIRIYDTRGIEISKNFDVEKLFNETLKDIKEKCEKNEPNDLIHCLLYCFTGTRFEKEEGEIIAKLRKTYEGKKLSIIIVYTQDVGEEEEESFKQSINKIIEEKCDESLSDNVSKISLVQVLAKKKIIRKKYTLPPTGLDILIQKCYEKGEYSSKFACLSAIKLTGIKKIKNDYLKIKNNNGYPELSPLSILIEKERFLDKFFGKHLEEKVFEDIIEKIFMAFSLMEYRELVNSDTFNYIKIANEKIIKLILEKEDKIFRDYIEEKSIHIATILMDEQTTIGKKYDFGFGNYIKDSGEFAYKINAILKAKFKRESKINAIKNAAEIVSLKIIDVFMNSFVQSYLNELESDDIKTYLENTVNGCFSSELKNKIDQLIEDLKKYQKDNDDITPSGK